MNRSVALGAAWSASAIAAVGLGFLAVSLVDASASPGTSRASSTNTPVPLATGDYITAAGTVFADCSSGSPALAGAPAAGWWADDSNDPGEFEFKSASQKLEVHVSCLNGSPQFSDEGLRADDNGGRGGDDGTHSSSSSSSSASASHSSGRDDSSGHGSDDSGGDDSSGRGGGGHGSDD
jgi:hypothetical protein